MLNIKRSCSFDQHKCGKNRPIVGIDSINWINPTELDTNQYQMQHHYEIINSNENIIHQFSPKNFLYEPENKATASLKYKY